MTAPKITPQTHDSPESTAPGEERSSKLRKTVAGALLSIAVAAVFAASGWGLFSAQVPQTASAVAARHAVAQGEAAEVPGGLLRVDDVIPEHMAPMQMDKFQRSGMSMSGMGMDMAPEGQRRFTVELSLAAGSGGLEYSARDFELTGEGMEPAAPIRTQLGDGVLPAGTETRGSLIFQAPQDASGLVLSFDGGDPVALELEGSGSSGHGHASGEGSQSGGHPDGHDH